MAQQHPAFCSNCGSAYQPSTTWPKVCASCHREAYGNPVPVAVVVCPLDNRVLLVQRNLVDGFGLWANPGGFVNNSETPEGAARRELREETEHRNATDELLRPGLDIPTDAFVQLLNVGLPDLNQILMFYYLVGVDHLLQEWWREIGSRPIAEKHWNAEVQRLALVDERDFQSLSIAFSSHAEVLRRWFAQN